MTERWTYALQRNYPSEGTTMHVEPRVELAADMPRDRRSLCGLQTAYMTWSGHTDGAHKVTCKECRRVVNAVKADLGELRLCDKCAEPLDDSAGGAEGFEGHAGVGEREHELERHHDTSV
jgi:hypothetical protein